MSLKAILIFSECAIVLAVLKKVPDEYFITSLVIIFFFGMMCDNLNEWIIDKQEK